MKKYFDGPPGLYWNDLHQEFLLLEHHGEQLFDTKANKFRGGVYNITIFSKPRKRIKRTAITGMDNSIYLGEL